MFIILSPTSMNLETNYSPLTSLLPNHANAVAKEDTPNLPPSLPNHANAVAKEDTPNLPPSLPNHANAVAKDSISLSFPLFLSLSLSRSIFSLFSSFPS